MENVTTNGNKGETKNCKYCQAEIPKKAKVCPNCRKKQGGKVKWILIALIAIAIIGAALGGEDDSATKTGNVSNKTENAKKSGKSKKSDTKEESNVEENNCFSVGDVVEASDLKISYLSAEKYTSDNEFIQPKEGNVFYRMEFEFENIGDSDKTVGMFDWHCYADGYAVDQIYITDDDLSATLSPGKKKKGAVYYEIPKNAKEITLEYETNYFTEKKIIFVIK